MNESGGLVYIVKSGIELKGRRIFRKSIQGFKEEKKCFQESIKGRTESI